MNPDRWPDVERLYEQAIALAADQRADFLDKAAAGDDELRREVLSLISFEAVAPDFLEQPALRAAATTLSEALPHLKLPVVPGYHIIRELGEGGMGVVYLAEQRVPLQRVVALKLIRPGMDSRHVLARFERERQALARMDHPNIAAVFDAGSTADGRPYFVMEFVNGVAITEYCDSVHLSIRERLALFIQVCNAVQHAHQKGVIHRDLKPSNVLVIDQDGQPVPKVIDFGTAKSADPAGTQNTLTTDGLVFGTVEYMSPEQAAFSSDIDTTTDVYSLGVLLYELLVGCTPFSRQRVETKTLEGILKAIRDSDPPRPSNLLTREKNFIESVAARGTDVGVLTRQLAGDLDWIVLKALEKDRHRRYQTAASLGADVQRFQDSRPIEARPPSLRYRVRKFARRYRGAVAAAAAVTLTLILGLIVSTTLYLWAMRSLEEARTQRGVAELRQKETDAAMIELANRSYVATIAFADTEVRSGRLASLVSARQRLLDVPPSQRNWEWWQLYNQTDAGGFKVVSAMRACGVPGTPVDWQSIAFDAVNRSVVLRRCSVIETWDVTGARRASLSTEQQILAVDVVSRTLVTATINWKPGPRWSVRFFNRWTRDPKYIVELGKFEDSPHCADIAHDGQRVVLGFRNREGLPAGQSRGHVFEVWKLGAGRTARFVQTPDRDPGSRQTSCSVRFSPDGNLVASSGTTVDVWDAVSGVRLLKDGDLPSVRAQPIAFSPSGETLAIGRANGSIDVRRIADAGMAPLTLGDGGPAQRGAAILALAFSPDGLTLASAAGRAVTLWDLERRTNRLQVGHDGDIVGIVMSADSRHVYAADVTGQVRGWSVQLPAVVTQSPIGVRGYPSLFSDGAMVLGYLDVLRLPDLQPIGFRPDLWKPSLRALTRVLALSSDGTQLYIAEYDPKDEIRLVVLTKDRAIVRDQVFPRDGPRCTHYESVMALSRDDRYLAIGNAGCVVVFDALTLQPVANLRLNPSLVISMLFGRDGALILATRNPKADGRSATLAWDWKSGKTLATVSPQIEGVPKPTWRLTQSSNGERIAMLSTSFPATLVICDRELREVGRLQLQVEPASEDDRIGAALSPDGSRAVIVSRLNPNVQLWDTASSSLLLNLPDSDGHTPVVAFTKFGQIITGRLSGGLTIWDPRIPPPR